VIKLVFSEIVINDVQLTGLRMVELSMIRETERL
jgi:hypothetical protein